MKNILVTGAGALLGQGILRCLQFSSSKYNLITADPDYRAQGHCFGTKAYVIPYANDCSYISTIGDIIAKEKIDFVLIGTDIELPIFADNQRWLEENYQTTIIVSNSKVVEISNDKWLTAEFLRKNDFPFPMSALTSDFERINTLKKYKKFPFIAKPVDGARSKGIQFIETEAELNEICSYSNNLVVQELLSEDEGEFTTGCLVIDGKCKATVSLKRDLRDGNTYRAYRDGENKYDTIIACIAEKLGVNGPVNFQYRIRNCEPVVFEINGRFSGTTPLRYIFGFNEVEALLNHLCGIKELEQPVLRDGVVLRTFSDIYVENKQLERLKNNGSLSDYRCEYFPFYTNKER